MVIVAEAVRGVGEDDGDDGETEWTGGRGSSGGFVLGRELLVLSEVVARANTRGQIKRWQEVGLGCVVGRR